MTCSTPSSSFGKKDKYVTWIKNSFRTLVEFRKYVKQLKMGQILTINYAYEEKQKRQFLIIGKVVALPPKLPNNRKVISAKTVPATTLHIKELISGNDTLVFRKIFKVKFVGKIASDIESAGIHIGDRIVLVNPLIAENTDYLPSPHIDPLTALMFDDSFGLPASVLLSPKIPPGAEFPKNKLLARLRCSTPVSDGRSELEVSESEGIENKAKSSKMNKIGKRNIFEKHSRQISPKKNIPIKPIKPGYRRLTNDQCIHPALNDITVYDNERISPKKGKVQQRLNSSPVKSPAKQLSNVDLNDDISILEPCEGTSHNINDDMINSIVQFNKRENVQHDFIKIKDISEKHVNKNVNMFVIVLDVRQNEIEGKKKNCLIARVIDETCPKFKPFTVYMFYEDRKPKVEPKWILRIRHVKIECYKGVYDGRIFSAGSVVSFRPRCSGLEFEEPITLRKEPYESNDFDMNIVDNLRKFIIGKHWNLLVMLGGFYPTPPANIKQVTLEGITDETWFSLKCEINHVRIFFDFNIIVLTISDGTVLPHFSYRAPKDCKLWSEALSSREQYFSDQNQIDIIMKNVDPTFDHKILQENTEVLINNIQILRNKYKNLDALIFVLDASFPKSKIDVLPSLTNFKDFSETQEESNVISMSDEVGKKKTTTPSKLCQEKVKAVSSQLNDGSKNDDDDDVEIIVNERKEKEVNNDFSKPVLQKKKLFYVDSSNIDAYFSSSENTGDCFKNSKTKKSKCCSVVLNVIPESGSGLSTKNESDTALNDGSISDKNNLNSAEKIENFESCSKKRKIASGSDELPRINSSDFTNSEEKENVQSDGITSKELLVEKPNDASDNVYNHSRRSISPDNGKDVEPQEDQGNKEEWLQRMETDGPSNIDELHNACDMHDEIHQNKETRCDYNESKEMESQSQIISEFVKPETKGNPILSRQLPTVVVKKQLSYKVLMWDLQPKLTDDPLDIVSGLCETSCENFFLYSTLKYTSELTPICPLCFREGKEVAVKLNFLFELLLVLQTGHSITALVYGNHATKLLGCTVEEYLQNSNVRQQTIQLLHHYLGAGHNLSMRYTPPFLAQLVPISLTPPNQPSVVRFCVINTELPPVNSERTLSTFIDTT